MREFSNEVFALGAGTLLVFQKMTQKLFANDVNGTGHVSVAGR